jgi:hypothetical protein
MDQIELDQSNQNAETVLRSAEDVSDEMLLRAAGSEAVCAFYPTAKYTGYPDGKC